MANGLNLSALKKDQKKNVLARPVSTQLGKGFDWKGVLTKEIRFFGSSLLSDKTREEFYLELSVLLQAGVDIKSSLELITEEQTKPAKAVLFSQINNAVISGKTLSDAVKMTNEFSKYEYFSIQIGEESGKLTRVLKELGAFYNKKVKQHRQIMSAMSYPIVVMVTAVGAVFFMITFVVPMFSGIFRRFGGELPYITKAVIAASAILKAIFPLLVLAFIGIWSLLYTFRNKPMVRKNTATILLKIPLFGSLMKKIYLARFSYSMTLLIGSKIPILRAIGLIKEMVAFYPIELALAAIELDILQGVPLHKGMSRHAIFPKRMVSLVKVGEEVNQLEDFFEKIACQYNEEVEYQTALISSAIEPIIIIFLGVIVGVILISMYLPLFKLGSTF